MGAHEFEDYEFGKTVGEAYSAACRHAEYEYGHDPYNGTISTTEGVAEVDPAGLKPAVFMAAAWEFQFAMCDLVTADEERRGIYTLSAGETARRLAAKPKIRRAFKDAWDRREYEQSKARAARWAKFTPAQVDAVADAGRSIQKRGPALAVRLTGKENAEAKARFGKKGCRGDVFLFFGLAAS